MSFEPRLWREPEAATPAAPAAHAPTESPDNRCVSMEQLTAEAREWFPAAEALAQQLIDDAARLTTRYPAGDWPSRLRDELAVAAATASLNTPSLSTVSVDVVTLSSFEQQPIQRTKSRRLLFGTWSTVAAVLVVAAVIGAMQWQPFSNDQLADVGPAFNHTAEHQPAVVTPATSASSDFIEAEDSSPYVRLTGAEQEAILDLIEAQNLPAVRLSI